MPTIVNPESLGAPKGWSHGMLAPAGGRLLAVAGMDAAEPEGKVPAGLDFVAQFDRCLEKILAVVAEAGGEARHVVRLTIYVTDLNAYRASSKRLGEAYRARMSYHYPAIALLHVKGLVDEHALVEIEATAVLPGDPS